MDCKGFSAILAVYPQNAKSTHPFSCDNQKCLPTLTDVPWGSKSPQIENHSSRDKKIMIIPHLALLNTSWFITSYKNRVLGYYRAKWFDV